MNELDRKIINELEKDSRQTNIEISKRLKLSEGTVRKRVHRLVDKGLLKFTVAITSKIGFTGIVLAKTSTQVKTPTIVENMKKIEDVKEIFEVSGDADIVLKVAADSPESFNSVIEKLRGIHGVLETKTYAVLKIS